MNFSKFTDYIKQPIRKSENVNKKTDRTCPPLINQTCFNIYILVVEKSMNL